MTTHLLPACLPADLYPCPPAAACLPAPPTQDPRDSGSESEELDAEAVQKFATPLVVGTADPEWNHDVVIRDVAASSELVVEVWGASGRAASWWWRCGGRQVGQRAGGGGVGGVR